MTDWQPFTERAKDWFETLRDDICAAFEAIEREAGSDAAFEYTPWQREEEGNESPGGGVRGVMKGQVFEKVGVNVSTVHGRFARAGGLLTPVGHSTPQDVPASADCAARRLAALTARKRLGSLAKACRLRQVSGMVPLSFAGEEFAITQGRALYWPRERALLVADLHLEKASFFARHGQMLPPYDSRETLERLALAIRETGARRVYTLGDNFHDSRGVQRLEPHAAGMLAALTRATDWVWITGNHDHAMEAAAGGTLADELELAGLVLRHRAKKGEARPELSGHYHPRLHLTVRDRRIRRACAVVSAGGESGGRMILPAFGALTGGMDAADPAILEALQPARAIDAVLPAGGKLATFPLWRAAA